MNGEPMIAEMENSMEASEVEAYVPLVYRIAGLFAHRAPRPMTREDLVSAGMQGLAEAARGFDDNRGAVFGTYAYLCIRRRVVDELRQAYVRKSESLDGYGEESLVTIVPAADGRQLDREETERLEAAVENLLPKLRRVVRLYYYESLTMRQIGDLMELTESRISQLLHEAVHRLGVMLKDNGNE